MKIQRQQQQKKNRKQCKRHLHLNAEKKRKIDSERENEPFFQNGKIRDNGMMWSSVHMQCKLKNAKEHKTHITEMVKLAAVVSDILKQLHIFQFILS